jgi:hypothetical protein
MRMMRGVQKRMIVLRTGGSRYFDEAYFVLRREADMTAERGDEMIAEANRIVAASVLPSGGRRRRGALLCFLCGILCGGLASSLLWCLVCLL